MGEPIAKLGVGGGLEVILNLCDIYDIRNSDILYISEEEYLSLKSLILSYHHLSKTR